MWKWIAVGVSSVAGILAVITLVAVGAIVMFFIRRKQEASGGAYGVLGEQAYGSPHSRHSVNIYGSNSDLDA